MLPRSRSLLLFAALLLAGIGGFVVGPAPVAAAPRGSTSTDHVLSFSGAGPYRIGARLDRLVAAGLVDPAEVDPTEPGDQITGVTGEWAGQLLLMFRGGVLVALETATGSVHTVAGARVGMSFDEVDGLYHGRGHMITGASDRHAYLVQAGPLVLLFTDHPIRPGVGAIQAGLACVVLPQFQTSAATL